MINYASNIDRAVLIVYQPHFSKPLINHVDYFTNPTN